MSISRTTPTAGVAAIVCLYTAGGVVVKREISNLEAAYGMQFNPRGYTREFDNAKVAVVRVSCPHGCGLSLVLKPGVTVWENRHVKLCGKKRNPLPGLGASLAERLLE